MRASFCLFTQHQTAPIALPGDVKDSLPSDLREKKNLNYRDLPEEIVNELWKRFAQALLPQDSAGKLGMELLFQFPPWFFPGEREREHIALCHTDIKTTRVCLSVADADVHRQLFRLQISEPNDESS